MMEMVLCIKWRGLYMYAGMVIPRHLLDRISELKTLVQQNFSGSLAILPGKTTVGLHTPERSDKALETLLDLETTQAQCMRLVCNTCAGQGKRN